MTQSSDSLRDALNRHGVFLKKAVLSELQKLGSRQLTVFGEEVGTSFGGTRVADIIAVQYFGDNSPLFFVIECKRTRPDKQWIFFKHFDRQYRVARATVDAHPSSTLESASSSAWPCSEGYEFPGLDKAQADQDPVFKAASQLSAAFLGFIDRRKSRRYTERYVPILITTAELLIVDDWPRAPDVPLATGELQTPLNRTSVNSLILKHPFPTPPGVESDFREKVQNESWVQNFTESIHVVRATALQSFLTPKFRESLWR